MEKDSTVTLTLTQEELKIIHTTVCEHRVRVGNVIYELAGLCLPTDEARALSNQLGELSHKLCELCDE